MSKRICTACICLTVSVLVSASTVEMTYEQYESELVQAQQREMNAKEQIAREQASIESIRQQIGDIDQRILAVIQERYSILGATEQDALGAQNEAASIRQELQDLYVLMPQELLARGADITKAEARIADLKARPVMKLWKLAPLIPELESLLEQVKARVPAAQSSPGYTVRLDPLRRDCLYRIARNPEVYNDAAQWPRIYRANQGLIDGAYERYRRVKVDSKYSRAEDLIFPGQTLDIPR